MALKIPIPFPITAPPVLNPNPNPTHHRPPSELRFSRWNNANAEPFNERRRAQQEIEDDIRRERRFDSANRIARYYDAATPNNSSSAAAESFKSAGTPSFPSKRSIPGRKSKYSKNPYPNPNPNPNSNSNADSRHPAFRQLPRTKVPVHLPENPDPAPTDRGASVRLSDDGVSYVIDGAPFEFKYSYTETPKVKPLGLREAAFVPFGPVTMPRPWTGRAPLPPSKKKLPEFDSFRLPPPSRKGVKTVQAPGPYLPGSGPRYVRSRKEILGDPLTKEEIRELIDGCKRTQRQLNMGRDGLTHNMLDNIHAHWKRRRACKIKCKGVCTVDMDNVLQQLEERTGGKIIFNKGGVIYLFRGRNYNYRTRPRYPLMLWRPITPVYPRLVQRIPEGTTLEEVTEMRKKGHRSIPICKLGKNGMYSNLVNHVREAFEECELARINCEGLNGSDYRKIGAKLRDLVPCVLLSFAYDHILMWRGRDWKSSLPNVGTANSGESKESSVENGSVVDGMQKSEDSSEVSNLDVETRTTPDIQSSLELPIGVDIAGIEVRLNDTGSVDELSSETSTENEDLESNESQQLPSKALQDDISQPEPPNTVCTEAIRSLLQQALESGSATILDDADLDADIVYQKMVDFSQSAPPGPVFRHRLRKVLVKAPDIQENNVDQDILDLEPQPISTFPTKAEGAKNGGLKPKPKPKTYKKSGFSQKLEIVVPQGSLRVDELAKLLA